MLIHGPPVQCVFIITTFSKELEDKTTFSQQHQYTTLSNFGLQKNSSHSGAKFLHMYLDNIYEVYLNIIVKRDNGKRLYIVMK